MKSADEKYYNGGKGIMKILITGCRGQLGLELSRQLKLHADKYEIVETDIHNLDICEQASVFKALEESQPDMVINCAAYTNVDRCEQDEMNAFRVNAVGAQNLAAGSSRIGAGIVQVSTDYVFDGTECTPRREYDTVNPQCCYGKSKNLGEILVRETNPRHFIVRTAWLYGEGSNFIRTILRLAGEKDCLSVVNDQFGSPTSVKDLAIAIINLINTGYYGTFHATCEGECSWFDFAQKIFRLKGMSVDIRSITTDELNRPAKRPRYSVLDNFMLKLIGINNFRHWEDALDEYLKGRE